MIKIVAIFTLAMTLAACAEEPAPKPTEKTVGTMEKGTQQDAVKERQRTMDEAAEEATKLIEADAKSEVDEMNSRGFREIELKRSNRCGLDEDVSGIIQHTAPSAYGKQSRRVSASRIGSLC